jgi:hypothetical protein
VDQDRDRLRDLSARLLRLHGILLDRERLAYEERHGSVASRELLHLLLHDAQFSWLRSLSSMIAKIDEVVDADEPLPPQSVQSAFREAYRLLKSGAGGDFRTSTISRWIAGWIMAHAAVSRVLSDPDSIRDTLTVR